MTDTSHTLGPWTLHFDAPTPDYQHPYMRLNAGDGIGDENGLGGFHLSGIISEPDARLISAAPEMLAALHHAIDAIEYGCPEFEAMGENGKLTLDIIKAAITKAGSAVPATHPSGESEPAVTPVYADPATN